MNLFVIIPALMLVIFNQFLFINCETKDKYISAKVYSKWSDTPFSLETGEFIFRNNPDSFWNYVNDINSIRDELASSSNVSKKSYDLVLNIAKGHLNALELNLLELSLSIRSYSPAIEASRKLADELHSDCGDTLVEINGKVTCDINEIKNLIQNADINNKPFIYKYDKVHPSTNKNEDVVVILYANIETKEFKEFHDRIVSLVGQLNKKFTYLLRFNTNRSSRRRVCLSGYGVELDIKSTEYKAKDDTKVKQDESQTDSKAGEDHDESIQGFMFSRLKTLHPQLNNELDEFRKYLIESQQELAPLKAWQTQDLSVQAVQHILETDTSEQLNTLRDISQNFPLLARSLSKLQLKKDVRQLVKNQQKHFESSLNLDAGSGAFYINGMEIALDSIDAFSLTSQLIKEAKLLESLYKIGLNLEQINKLIYLDLSSKQLEFGVDIRDSSIQWLNDLENDKKYADWPKNMQEILRPTYPGMLRSIAKNFFNLVFIINPSIESSRNLLKTAESFYLNELPIRIGFVFVSSNEDEADGYKDASVALFRAHNYIKQKDGPVRALGHLTDMFARAKIFGQNQLSAEFVVAEFKRLYPNVKSYDDVFGVDSDYDEGRKLSMEYYNKIGLKQMPQVLINGYPLKENEIEADSFEDSVITKIMHLTSDLQMAIYHSRLHEGHNLFDWLMNKETIMPRLNSRLLYNAREYLEPNNFDTKAKEFVKSRKYLTQTNDKTQLHPLTIWVVCDPDTENGRKFLYNAIDFYERNSETRLAIFFNSEDNDNSQIKKAISYALNNLRVDQARTFIQRILREKFYNDIKQGKTTFSKIEIKDLQVDNLDEIIKNVDLSKELKHSRDFILNNLKYQSTQDIGLVANGWIIGPLDKDEEFIDSDFNLLHGFLKRTGLGQLESLFRQWVLSGSNSEDTNDLLLLSNSILGKYSANEKRIEVPGVDVGSISIPPRDPNYPYFNIIVVLDPLSRFAQKASQILIALKHSINSKINVFFNCKDKLSALPLKSFYRYVFEPEIRFNKNGGLIEPSAYFHNMPQSPLLTMNMHPPEGWMIEASKALHDLDNIYLKEVEGAGVYGEYELEHLIIEGHAFDALSGQSPRGLQFNLGTSTDPTRYDTIVMANLGYFQLKSSPGIWFLQLREGRSKDIYEIVSHENTDSESRKSAQVAIVMDSFEAKIIKVKVSKKPDKANENLLDSKDDDEYGGILAGFWDSGSKEVKEPNDPEDDVLNIFSVASGHLYERFLRIMMLTVLKNTKTKVKFWFLKNYLSPQFTKFLPYYAQEYKFDYELVQYKWPRWLHKETEKQRIIWGYKILFLDVLFPLNVKKIIFVDADQIVRADLTELRDIDLKGAPYGYTPFCDSRKEMEGYRFWKQGYWAMHLGHRKYHISALYVVDLKKFRKIAAGDRLRGQYQGLSQDPNSLSNLDQDLPNNMIHQVNIFSLPQEWLYCDTWCSSDTLKSAKTIDLCNNPQTKEHKLEAAVRIVPEWKDYDNEIKNVMEKWQSEQSKTTQKNIPHDESHIEL